MNKMLISIFDNEIAAQAGLRALRKLHDAGDITLYSTGMLVKDSGGNVSVRQPKDQGGVGAGLGLAVGSLIGLLGGPVGLVVGAVTGTVAGAIRDYWVAGVGRDFIEETDRLLIVGKVALVAEIEEEWVIPVDDALEAAGAQVFRRTRSELVEELFDHNVAALNAEIKELEVEFARASGAARSRLHSKIAGANTRLEDSVQRIKDRLSLFELEAKEKGVSLQQQFASSKGEAAAKIEARANTVKASYHERGAKLSRAWGLAKDALSV